MPHKYTDDTHASNKHDKKQDIAMNYPEFSLL